MPFQSKAQNAWAHTAEGTKALGGAAKVKEWEGATDYSHLPQKKAKGGPIMNKDYKGQAAHFASGGAVQDPPSKDFKKEDGQSRGDFGRFLGSKDRFSDKVENARVANARQSQETNEDWTKKGRDNIAAEPTGDSKSEIAVKPRGGGKRHGSVNGG